MQINNAYGGAYLKSLDGKKDKELSKTSTENLKKTIDKSDAEINISDAINTKTKEYSTQLKTLQTEVSNNQSILADTDKIKDYLQELKSNFENNNEGTVKTNKEILESINEVMANSLMDSGEVSKNISTLEAKVAVGDVKDGVVELEKVLEGIDTVSEAYQHKLNMLNDTVKKISIAKENNMAAESNIDNENINATLQEISSQSGKAMGVQTSNVSQTRVFEILRTE